MKHLIMIGAGGFGRECYWHALNSIGFGTEFDLKGYLDDTPDGELREDLLQMPRIGTIDDYEIQPNDVFICTIGSPQGKAQIVNRIEKRLRVTGGGGRFFNLIHKTALVLPTAKLGSGIVLTPNTIVSDHVTLGNHVCFNFSSTCGHDSNIGDFSSVMAHCNICGNVRVGERVYIASSAILIPRSKVEDDSHVGAGSLILKRVRAGHKVCGHPAINIPNIF